MLNIGIDDWLILLVIWWWRQAIPY